MAQPLHYSFLLVSFFLAISFSVAFSSKHDYPIKSLHITLYEHGRFNKTAYLIVKGVDTGVALSKDATPFGSLVVFHDPLTIKPNSSSKVVGFMEGIGVVSTLDGFQFLNVIKATLNLKNHKGSISVVGAAPFAASGNMTIVAGTGDFLFVQGYLASTPIDVNLSAFDYKNEFHLYWPPYAATY